MNDKRRVVFVIHKKGVWDMELRLLVRIGVIINLLTINVFVGVGQQIAL